MEASFADMYLHGNSMASYTSWSLTPSTPKPLLDENTLGFSLSPLIALCEENSKKQLLEFVVWWSLGACCIGELGDGVNLLFPKTLPHYHPAGV